MPRLLHIPLIILVLCILIVAGCTSPNDDTSRVANSTPDEKQIVSSYQITLAQPDSTSDYIQMDTDVFNAGEVVEFIVTNNGLVPLQCTNTPPGFSVIYQTGTGRWATRMGSEVPVIGNSSFLKNGESTKYFRFVTTGWDAGRYRIVSDCGVERDFLIRELVTPVPTATPCPVTNTTPSAPWIKIDPVGDQYTSRPFTISGTTNLPAGQELRYTIFSVLQSEQAASLDPRASFTTVVNQGACGINTWSAEGEIQADGEFFIGISDTDRKATAIKRFSVYPA